MSWKRAHWLGDEPPEGKEQKRLKRSRVPIRTRKRPNPKSKKRIKEEREYKPAARAFKAANPECMAMIPNECTEKTTDVHHIRGRAGRLLLDERFWLAVCRNCHRWIESNKKLAQDWELLAKQGEWGVCPEE